MTRPIVFTALCTMLSAGATHVLAQEPLRLSVSEAVTRAFETSHRIAEGRARQTGAEATVQVRQSAQRPTVSASAAYMRTNHVEAFGFPQTGGGFRIVYPDVPDNAAARVSLQWPIYTAGRLDALERAAAAEASATGADINTTRADLRLEVERTYWALATGNEAVRVLTESLARADAQVRDAQNRVAAGIASPDEVFSFEAQRSQEQLQLIEAQNLHASVLVELRRLVDVADGVLIEPSESLSPTDLPPSAEVSDLVVRALNERPERQALLLRIAGAEAREQAAALAMRPTIGAGGGLDYANPNVKIFPREATWRTSWDLSVNVTWPILDGGRSKAETAEARAVVTAARERLADLDAIVTADVRQRMLDLASAQAAVRAADSGVRSAAEARRVLADRFAAGVATNVDVLIAQDALLKAELSRTRALANVRLAEARLARAVGTR